MIVICLYVLPSAFAWRYLHHEMMQKWWFGLSPDDFLWGKNAQTSYFLLFLPVGWLITFSKTPFFKKKEQNHKKIYSQCCRRGDNYLFLVCLFFKDFG